MDGATATPNPFRPLAALTPRARRSVRALLAVFTAILLVSIVVIVTVSDSAWREVTSLPIGWVAAVVVGARAVLVERERLAWGLMASGCAALAVADLAWSLVGMPDLSFVDGVYLAGHALLLGSVVVLLVHRAARTTRLPAMDALGAGLAVGAALAVALMPRSTDSGVEGISLWVNLAYPALAVLLLSTCIGIAVMSGWRPGWNVVAAALGGVMMIISEGLYVSSLVGRDLAELAWLISWVLLYGAFAWAAWLPGRRPAAAPQRAWRSISVAALTSVGSVALLVAATVTAVHPVAVALAVAAIGAMLMRSPLQLLEVRALDEDLAEAEARAARDPITGLLNHRGFHERLADRVATTRHRGGALALVLLDIDGFAEVNDTLGHEVGDRVIREVGSRIEALARPDDVVGRIGGGEFAWLLPGADDLAAWEAAERARRAVRGLPVGEVPMVTVSGGVTDMCQAAHGADLLRLAGGALYWAKHHGRDVVFRYSSDVVHALSAEERAAQLSRGQARNAMHVLARAVDARDPYTQRHSERVADLSVQLATALGWPTERIVQLREAALVHDVGKIGIPDAVLLKPGPLTPQERVVVNTHAALGAQIVQDVLSDEQASWVRSHHERYDGGGYPDGLAGSGIPDGARVLAVADAWDAMTTDRPYGVGVSPGEALRRVRAGGGTQFDPEVVEAMLRLVDAGAIASAVPVR